MKTDLCSQVFLCVLLFQGIFGQAQGPAVSGSGTTNFIPRWTGTTTPARLRLRPTSMALSAVLTD